MIEELTLYQCGTCHRYYHDEVAIRTHQNVYAKLHAHDPEISEHDGQPWTTETFATGYRGSIGRWWCEIRSVQVPDAQLRVDHESSREFDRRASRAWIVRENSFGEDLALDDQAMADRASGSLEADDERVREFAAAIALGIDSPEVSIDEHIERRRQRWYQPSTGTTNPRAHVEEMQLLARISLMTFNEARRRVS